MRPPVSSRATLNPASRARKRALRISTANGTPPGVVGGDSHTIAMATISTLSFPSVVDETTRRQALLVIHGMGQQRPYEMLDFFGRGLLDCLLDRLKPPDSGSTPPTNKLRPPELAVIRIAGSQRSEVSLRLRYQLNYAEPPRELDIYEYYWAPHTKRLVTDKAVLLW